MYYRCIVHGAWCMVRMHIYYTGCSDVKTEIWKFILSSYKQMLLLASSMHRNATASLAHNIVNKI